MQSAVEADLSQLRFILSIYRRMEPAIDASEIAEEIAARLREELDYAREARHIALYTEILKDPRHSRPRRAPRAVDPPAADHVVARGPPAARVQGRRPGARNLLARSLFHAWWWPFCGHGVIHGDPHLGNYTAWLDDPAAPAASICSTTAASASSRRSSSPASSTSTAA
jgi:predicted unusual protein kinase regulating ubiquinone biosynthesis (AarF/ABC1/UbiB family)